MNLNIVILAAGQGTRMKSALPKVLHRLAGKPLLQHVVERARSFPGARIHVVCGHGGNRVRERLANEDIGWIEQTEQLGTGHAVQQALPVIEDDDTVLVLYGDVPLISAGTLHDLLEQCRDGALALLTVKLQEPSGYGRIVRDGQGRVVRVVEEKDASEDERGIDEVNTGILAVNGGCLRNWLGRLSSDNAQGEYYLTDVIAMAVADGIPVRALRARNEYEAMGVNDRAQLARLERWFQRCQADELMRAGLGLSDPSRFDLRGRLRFGRDVLIDINAVLEGEIVLGDDIEIGPNCLLRNVRIGDGARILANSVIEDAVIGDACHIGPFARVRPETELATGVRVGNFVEVKKSRVGRGSKINHLSYIGDSRIGEQVNVGAGVITCNYDGANKHRTEIGDDAFIGSGSQLVAPVRIGAGATIGAGSTITRDAPESELSLSRSKQQAIRGWKRPVKKT